MNNMNDSIWPSLTRHRFSRPFASPLPGIPADDVTLDAAIDDLLRLVVDRDPDFYAVLGPDGEVDPEPDRSPLSLARMKTSGTIVKGKSTGKPKKSGEKLSLDDLALEDEDEDKDEV